MANKLLSLSLSLSLSPCFIVHSFIVGTTTTISLHIIITVKRRRHDARPGPLASDEVADEDQRIEHSDDDVPGLTV